jgi:serine/threonine protein kinase/Tol biopolymer transport system component
MSMIGKSLTHYEITSQIGKGGMGEVYQAKDTKLGRDVAIKVLPEEFALDTDRVARFQREAKLLASLNHPNIAAIYGLEESEGTHFLVMELIEGQTLSDRIKTGPIPVKEALKLALQVAEALEAAHGNGVIHRDLKPSNIKVTPDGKVKVLDFGLAKAYAGDQENISPLDSPTISAADTQKGVVLGTAAYMPPEQAKGKTVDKRADIWAFGVVLFEMLTGRQLFTGETASETLASVMKSEPEWDNLPPNLHSRIRFLLERCLEKDPKNRYSGISDVRVEIQKVLADPSGVFAQPSVITKPRRKLQLGIPLVAATAILCLIIAGVAVWFFKPPEPRQVMRFSYELPEGQQFTADIQLAVSSDGSQFVYRTTDGLYLRSVDAFDARHVAGTDQTSAYPVFSPDGKWLGYWSSTDRKLKKIAISGGVPVVLCDTSALVGGLSWSSDNTIVYSDVTGGGVKRVSADGGTPESIIEAELAKLATDGLPVAPQMLPDGKTVLFTNAFSATNMADRQITVQSLKSGERKVLVGGIGAMYLSSGHLVFLQVNNNISSLVAVPFDPNTLEVKGGPVPLLEGVRGRAVSDSGTLVYVPGTSGSGSGSTRTLVWVDKKGNEEQIESEPNMLQFPKISPDGTKVALSIERDGNVDIWIWDLIRENLSRLTFDEADDGTPMWTPDGKRIVFASARDGLTSIFWKAADGTGEVEKLGSVPGQRLFPWSWSSDGKTLVTAEMEPTLIDVNIGAMSMEGDREQKLLLKSDHIESHPRISPDGRWMAYFSDETGDWHIFVRPFPEVDQGKWQVSVDGGQSPLWSPDGRELYFLNGDAIMAAQVNTEPTFSASKPKTLFRGNYVTGYMENPEWDISPDGKRFVMIKPTAVTDEDSEPEIRNQINIVLNWDVELKQRVPVD